VGRVFGGRGEGAYSEVAVGVRVGSTSLFEDGGDHVVEIVVCVGVVEAFGEAVDENSWVGRFNLNFGVRAVAVAYG